MQVSPDRPSLKVEPPTQVTALKYPEFFEDILISKHIQGTKLPDLSDRHITIDAAKQAERELISNFIKATIANLPNKYEDLKKDLLQINFLETVAGSIDLLAIKTSVREARDKITTILQKVDQDDLDILKKKLEQVPQPKIFHRLLDLVHFSQLTARGNLDGAEKEFCSHLAYTLLKDGDVATVTNMLPFLSSEQKQSFYYSLTALEKIIEAVRAAEKLSDKSILFSLLEKNFDLNQIESVLPFSRSLNENDRSPIVKQALKKLLDYYQFEKLLELSKKGGPFETHKELIFSRLLIAGEIEKAKTLVETKGQEKELEQAQSKQNEIDQTIEELAANNPLKLKELALQLIDVGNLTKGLLCAAKAKSSEIADSIYIAAMDELLSRNNVQEAQTVSEKIQSSINKAKALNQFRDKLFWGKRYESTLQYIETSSNRYENLSYFYNQLLNTNEFEMAKKWVDNFKTLLEKDLALNRLLSRVLETGHLSFALQMLPEVSEYAQPNAYRLITDRVDRSPNLLPLLMALPEQQQAPFIPTIINNLLRQGELEKAFLFAMELSDANAPVILQATNSALGDLGKNLIKKEKVENAEKLIPKMKLPDRDYLINHIGEYYLKKGNLEKAVQMANQEQDSDGKLFAQIGFAYIQRDDFTNAAAVIGKIQDITLQQRVWEDFTKDFLEQEDYHTALKCLAFITDPTKHAQLQARIDSWAKKEKAP